MAYKDSGMMWKLGIDKKCEPQHQKNLNHRKVWAPDKYLLLRCLIGQEPRVLVRKMPRQDIGESSNKERVITIWRWNYDSSEECQFGKTRSKEIMNLWFPPSGGAWSSYLSLLYTAVKSIYCTYQTHFIVYIQYTCCKAGPRRRDCINNVETILNRGRIPVPLIYRLMWRLPKYQGLIRQSSLCCSPQSQLLR